MSDTQKNPNPLRLIPAVDQIIWSDQLAHLRESVGLKRLTALARLVTTQMRKEISSDNRLQIAASLFDEAVLRIRLANEAESKSGIRHVINATGVVLHTNLGRAPLSAAALNAITEASRYCTLEYDPLTGTRGARGSRVEHLLQQLTGAEDALVVNNCAAAALLILSVLADDGETIVSRGELVEIGGDFRVPDVMATSGTVMVEVGTTNKTHLNDYRRALNDRTRLIMRVHPSNYRIVGFTSTPANTELAGLAHAVKLPFYVDAGSGQMNESGGLADEPTVASVITDGADIVSFSGDKLLGSVQAGLIVGKREIVSRLRGHPLYRALRSDKIRLAALAATLDAHDSEVADQNVPAARMLAMTEIELSDRAQWVAEQISNSSLTIEIVKGESAVGGGAAPTTSLPTTLITVSHGQLTANELDQRLRTLSVPIIARIADDKVLIDLRTVFEDEVTELVAALEAL